jgi:hypothetical protein
MAQAIIAALESGERGEIEARAELDSHADSPVVGIQAHVINYTGSHVTVSGFTDSLGKKKAVPIVDAVVAYDCDMTGDTHLLVLHNALYIPEMTMHLIPPFIMRLAGLLVDECPKFLANNASIKNHSLFFPDHDIRIPLHLRGIVSYFPCRRPTKEELNDGSLLTVNLTPETPEWNPHDEVYGALEAAMVDYKGEIQRTR